MAETATIPPPSADWKGDSDANPHFKSLGKLSSPINRKIEPYGAQFLAYARRKRHGRTFSEDDRIQALSKVKKSEDDDDGEISEPEDPLMLARDAKDWKVSLLRFVHNSITDDLTGTRSLRCARSIKISLQGY
jgi:DnaJ family protein C protein 2